MIRTDTWSLNQYLISGGNDAKLNTEHLILR